MTRPPWWAMGSSFAAPILLIGGWLVAQAAQPPGYDPVRETISALAREGLDHRWIMTTGLAGLGVAHVVTSLGLRGLPWCSRAVLGLAGVATALVAVFPEPYTGSSRAHVVCALVGFVALAVWPATLVRRRPAVPVVRRPAVAWSVTALSTVLLLWFGATLSSGPVGLSERAVTAQQALWPLIVVLALRRRDDRIGP